MSSDLEYIKHIKDEIEFLLRESANISYPEFIENPILTRAFERSIEIIGEASKKISDDFKQMHSKIDWRAIAGTRDKLVHDYFGIDYELLWDIIKTDILELKTFIDSVK